MKRRRVSKILIISVLFTSMFTGNAAAAPTPTEGNLQIQAKSAVLLDASTGTFLYEQNAHEQLPPASVTENHDHAPHHGSNRAGEDRF